MNKILNEEGLAYLWEKITSIFAKQNHTHVGTYSTTGHNHDGRYALANHSHEGATGFGTLNIDSRTIDLCPCQVPTYTVYDVTENGVEIEVTSAGANPVWHKIMLRNRTSAIANVVFRAVDTEANSLCECAIEMNGAKEATLVRHGSTLIVAFGSNGHAI